jgi:hypothetical protein
MHITVLLGLLAPTVTAAVHPAAPAAPTANTYMPAAAGRPPPGTRLTHPGVTGLDARLHHLKHVVAPAAQPRQARLARSTPARQQQGATAAAAAAAAAVSKVESAGMAHVLHSHSCAGCRSGAHALPSPRCAAAVLLASLNETAAGSH